MTGGLMQLVAYGGQDIHITGNPQITFFKTVYKHHTNFAIETIQQNLNGNITQSCGVGSRIGVTISRAGDLLSNLYMIVKRATFTYSGNEIYYPSAGYRFIDNVELTIGGLVIDKHYGDWMCIWNDLTLPLDKKLQLNKLLYGKRSDRLSDRAAMTDGDIYIPLNFWFCNNAGLALPLIALQYHKVELNIYLADNVFKNNSKYLLQMPGEEPKLIDISGKDNIIEDLEVWADYILLDTKEREKFASCGHEYLIEQVQTMEPLCVDKHACNLRIKLRFNHPVKELLWYIEVGDVGDLSGNRVGSTYRKRVEVVKTATLKFNSQERFTKRPGSYFTDLQRYRFHSGVNVQDFQSLFFFNNLGHTISGYSGRAGLNEHLDAFQDSYIPSQGIHSYSFALDPERYQPTGTCNFSRLDKASLHVECYSESDRTKFYWGTPPNISYKTVHIFAKSYNILKIMSGLGSLVYAN